MINLSSVIVSPEMTIVEALSVINKNGLGLAFVCEDMIVRATLSDGDVRRHILSNGNLDASVSEVANYEFKYAETQFTPNQIEELHRKWRINYVPVLDTDGKLIEIHLPRYLKEEKTYHELDMPVVIMAGGKGTRLHPYTKVLPKPLIPIGDLTITEHIINSFLKYKCTDFTMVINHKKNMIKAYFSDNPSAMYYMSFVEELSPLGTGGGLYLLKGVCNKSFFVTNCDILVFEDFSKIAEHHKSAKNLLTMVCAPKSFTIPYGAVNISEDGKILSITEKPSYSFLTNTGFYVLEPEFLGYIPDGQFNHITDLIMKCVEQGKQIGIYPIGDDQWADMGQHDEMDRLLSRIE